MKRKFVALVFLVLLLCACRTVDVIIYGTATPVPGMEFPVSDLFLSLDAFPENWYEEPSLPIERIDDPTVNHVFREWGGIGYGRAWQSFWRAPSIGDAEDTFAGLRISQFTYKRTPIPERFFTEFSQPEELSFRSELADESYLACGWNPFAYCEYIVRYRNYVTLVHMPLKTTFKNYSSIGLTYEQIDSIMIAVDEIFIQFFNEIYP